MKVWIGLPLTNWNGRFQGTGGGGFLGAFKRVVGGGSLFMTEYKAVGGPGSVAFAAKLPGHILPVEVTRGDPLERVAPLSSARAPAGHVRARGRQERDQGNRAVAPDRQDPLPRESQSPVPRLGEADPAEATADTLLERSEVGVPEA